MEERKVYVFNAPVNGQMNLTNCEVVINDRAGQVILNGGRLVNNGSLGMTIHGSGSIHIQRSAEPEVKVVYRDRIVEKPVIKRVFCGSDNSEEVAALKKIIKNLKKQVKELQNGIDTETARERDNYKLRIQEYQKEVRQLNGKIVGLEDSIEAFKEVNQNQAERIKELENQKTVIVKRDEYEPNRNDIKMITRNLHLFLDDRKREYEDITLNEEIYG